MEGSLTVTDPLSCNTEILAQAGHRICRRHFYGVVVSIQSGSTADCSCKSRYDPALTVVLHSLGLPSVAAPGTKVV